MTISYSQYTIPTISFAALLSVYGISFSSRILTQIKNRRELKRQNLLEKISTIEMFAEQYIADGKTEVAILQLHQVLQASLKVANAEFTAYLLNRIIDSYEVQDALLGKLVKRAEPSQRESAKKLLILARQLTQSLDNNHSFVKARVLTKIGNYLQSIGEQKFALQLLAEAVKSSQFIKEAESQIRVLVAISQEYLALQQIAEAEKILAKSLQVAKQIKNEDPGEQSMALESIAITYIKLGKAETALQIAQTITHVYFRANALSEVVQYLLKTNQLVAALEIAQTVEAPELKSKNLVEIAIIYAQQGQEKQAAQLFAAALEAVYHDEYYQGVVIQAYAKGGQVDAAYVAAQKLQRVETVAITLGVIATEYSKAGQTELADEILQKIIPLIQTPEALDPVGYFPGILGNAIQAKQYKLAFDLIINGTNTSFWDRGYWILQIGSAAIQDGNLELILEIAPHLESINIESRNQLLQKVSLIYSQDQQLEKALAIVQQIDNFGNVPYRVETLALIATEHGIIPQTEELFTKAIADARTLENQASSLALAIIARELFKIENQQLANELLDEAIQLALTEQDAFVLEHHLLRIKELFMQAKQYLAALQVVQVFPTDHRDYSLAGLANLLIENQQVVNNIVEELNKNAKTPEGKTWGLIAIAEAYIRTQKIPSAAEIIDLALADAKTIPGPESRTIGFGSHPDGSSTTFIEDERDRASSLEKIALLKLQIGEYKQALQVAQFIEDKTTRKQLIKKLADYKIAAIFS